LKMMISDDTSVADDEFAPVGADEPASLVQPVTAPLKSPWRQSPRVRRAAGVSFVLALVVAQAYTLVALNAARDSLSSLEYVVEEKDSRISALEEKESRISGLEDRVDEIGDSIPNALSLGRSSSENSDRIDALEGQVSQLDSRIGSVCSFSGGQICP
jgi:hypothetical protein